MKKRLRKKLGVKEFQKDGFPVNLILWLTKNEEEALDAFWDKLVSAVEAKGLLILGLVDTFFVFTDYRKVPQPAATDDDRRWMRDWLDQQAEVDGYWVGPLAMNWHPGDGPFCIYCNHS